MGPLKKAEIRQLKGVAESTTASKDVKNNNSIIGCRCQYNDNNVVENLNSMEGCECNCLHKASNVKLSTKEINQLKGGAVSAIARGNIKNTNGVAGCLCTFLDQSVVENNNTVIGCLCSCKQGYIASKEGYTTL